ncbi:MAG TPA: corrinoid protein [Anaerolineales bacterium]|nr:corrinoid protein [Anaerolineales bacterium]
MDNILDKIYDAIIEGQLSEVRAQVQTALDAGMAPVILLNEGMVPAMAEVGRLFEIREYFVPEMMMSARAMKAGLDLLKPRLLDANVPFAGRVVIGTVKGDLHDIGKNMVGMMLEGGGFEVIDLGVDVAPEAFVQAVRTHAPNLIGLSALLTTTMGNMQATISALEAAGLRGQVKVMVGGAPLTQEFADEIHADGFAPDASRAVSLAKNLIR